VNEVVPAIAARHGVPVERVRVVPAGVANHVYLLGDDLVLRIPRSPRYAADLVKEASVIQIARQAGIRTPAVVTFDPELPYLVIERVRGVEAGSMPVPDPRVYEQVGGELSKLHRLTPALPDLPVDGTPMDPWALVAELLVDGRLDKDTAGWLSEWFDRLAPLIPIAPLRVLIHGDISPQNLLMSEGLLTGIVDWGDAMLADPAVDFAKLPLTLVPAALTGYDGVNMEPRVLWHHLVWALARLRDPAGPPGSRHWTAPPASRLLGLLRFFTTTPYWRGLT
jgi:hygromycin-B 7''-O-kinase